MSPFRPKAPLLLRLTEKGEALETLTERMRVVLRYAEDAVKFDSAKLKNLGWSGRKPRAELDIPGQAGMLDRHKRERDVTRECS